LNSRGADFERDTLTAVMDARAKGARRHRSGRLRLRTKGSAPRRSVNLQKGF
jgi:hypothetical protein